MITSSMLCISWTVSILFAFKCLRKALRDHLWPWYDTTFRSFVKYFLWNICFKQSPSGSDLVIEVRITALDVVCEKNGQNLLSCMIRISWLVVVQTPPKNMYMPKNLNDICWWSSCRGACKGSTDSFQCDRTSLWRTWNYLWSQTHSLELRTWNTQNLPDESFFI